MQSQTDAEQAQLDWEAAKRRLEDAEDDQVVDLARRISNGLGFGWAVWTDEHRPHQQWMEALFRTARNLLTTGLS